MNYGRDDQDISRFLSSGVKPKHPLDRFVGRIINSIVDKHVIPWLIECLSKYDEYDFHAKMLDNTFDFVSDWKINHPKKYSAFIRGARQFKNKIDFDTDEVLSKVIVVLENNGWVVYSHEKNILWNTIEQVRKSIYKEKNDY